MKTQQLYLTNSYAKEMEAEILAIKPDGASWRVLLDKTVFYPMGGGQPTDQGILTADSWKAEVYQVLQREGEIWHFLRCQYPPEVGMKVRGLVNWERRYKNMRVHSAGHVVDFAMYQLGYSPTTLSPLKGDHGKKPYIVYVGTVSEDYRQKLEDKANELVQKNLTFETLFQPFASLQKEALYLQPGLPMNKPLRTLRLETIGAVADGGTQVKSTQEVGRILIISVEEKDGNTVVNYTLAA